jgi:p-aminobenzoyl-glutamate transporter AbgT
MVNTIFGGISRFLKLIFFWANFGKFWQFWAKLGHFVALAVAGSMPRLRLKSLKPHNF